MLAGIPSRTRLLPLCTLLLLFLSAAVAQQQVTFQGRYYGVAPTQVVTGDMNGDGLPDIVSATSQYHNVNVLLNNGNGTFQDPGRVFAAGDKPCAVALADFNEDGKLDVASADCNSTFVDVLFGNGDGTLQPAIRLPLIGHPNSIAAADFNADGHPDIAVTMSDFPRVAIFFSKGGTQFTVPHDFTVGDNETTYLKSITAGDINHDGRPDLAVLACCKDNGAHVSVYRLNNETFANQTDQPRFFQQLVETGTALSVKLADIDEDGFADYIIPYSPDPTCTGSCTPIQGLTWIFNNPDGSTTTKSGYVIGVDGFYYVTAGAAVADLNGDGLNDLAVAVTGNRYETGDSVRYLLATGPRTFAPAEYVGVGGRQSAQDLAAADFNRDGLADMVTADTESEVADVLLAQKSSSTSGLGICVPPTSPGIQICSPTQGQDQQGGASFFQASASAPQGSYVQAMRLYVDDVSQYTTYSSSLITVKNLPTGTHKVVVVAWTSDGGVYTSKVLIGGCFPSGPGVQICSPTANDTVNSPVQVAATTQASAGYVTAMRFYVDNQAVYTQYNDSPQPLMQVTTSLPMASGDHYVAVVGYESTGNAEVTRILLHVR